jgi:hypothetical protein
MTTVRVDTEGKEYHVEIELDAYDAIRAAEADRLDGDFA